MLGEKTTRSLKYPPALSPPPNTAISSFSFSSPSTGRNRATCPALAVRLLLVLTVIQVKVPTIRIKNCTSFLLAFFNGEMNYHVHGTEVGTEGTWGGGGKQDLSKGGEKGS